MIDQLRKLAVVAGVLTIALSYPRPSFAADSPLAKLAAARFPNLTRAERALLAFADKENINRGESAIAGSSGAPLDPSNDPAHADRWPHDRDIRAQLIRWLAIDNDAMLHVDPNGVRVLGARILGPIDLAHVRVPFAMALIRCSIPDRMNLESSDMSSLDLDGSYSGEINAAEIKVDGPLQMEDGFRASAGVFMDGAKIDGDAHFWGGHLRRSKIESHPGFALWNAALTLSHAQIRGAVTMCCGFESHGPMLIFNTSIGGDFMCNGGRFINPGGLAFAAPELTVAGDVHLSDVMFGAVRPKVLEADGEVNFTAAQIGGALDAVGAKFTGARSDRHGLFAPGLVAKTLLIRNIQLVNDAVLDLTGAQVAALFDNESNWPKPGKLLIDGFKYGGFWADSPIDVSSRLRWIGLNDSAHQPTTLRSISHLLP
jgi:hypothetical protein